MQKSIGTVTPEAVVKKAQDKEDLKADIEKAKTIDDLKKILLKILK